MRTTVFGLTCYQPDFAMLVVAGNAGIVETAREHLGYAVALKIPICIVVTKIDVCPAAVVSRTLEQIQRTLKSPGCNKVPLLIRTEDDVVSAATNFKSDRLVFFFLLNYLMIVECLCARVLWYSKEFLGCWYWNSRHLGIDRQKTCNVTVDMQRVMRRVTADRLCLSVFLLSSLVINTSLSDMATLLDYSDRNYNEETDRQSMFFLLSARNSWAV